MVEKSLLVISDNYPSSLSPTRGVFVFQIAQQFNRFFQVKVISPKVLFKQNHNNRPLRNDTCSLFYPNYLSFAKSNNHFLSIISDYSKQKSILKAYKRLYPNSSMPVFIYTHFLWNAISALPLQEKLGVPMFVAMGESNPEQYITLQRDTKKLSEIQNQIKGFIVVSEKMRHFCIDVLKVSPEKILLAPNGVDRSKFYPISDKKQLLQKMGLNTQKFTISFLGAFIERKGIFELLEATKDMENVQLICIGKGNLPPSDKIAFAGTLPHEQINSYLNASDVFVFPTKAEGSSNALLEAAACGLPIITSNIPEVKEQIGEGNALFVPPHSSIELKNAIEEVIKNEQLKYQLSVKSLGVSNKYSLEKRAQNILKWIQEKISENE